MNTTVFVGCSFTKGEGLVGEKTSPDLWVNRLYQSVGPLKETTLINLAEGGNSNETIFHDAVRSLASSPKYLFVVWTIFPRFWINPSIELYNTPQHWGPATELFDINLHRVTYSKKYLTDIKNRFFDLIHDHYEIVKILEYSQTIIKLSKLSNTKVFFINGLLPWDNNYFNKQEQTVPSNTTQYTQSLLDADTRDDQEYWALYNAVHNAYVGAGLPNDQWLNLYHGYKKHFMLDVGIDDTHPGPLSNQTFSKFLLEKITF
jgi:hypothetical protein